MIERDFHFAQLESFRCFSIGWIALSEFSCYCTSVKEIASRFVQAFAFVFQTNHTGINKFVPRGLLSVRCEITGGWYEKVLL
jgi:hypothetical protein